MTVSVLYKVAVTKEMYLWMNDTLAAFRVVVHQSGSK